MAYDMLRSKIKSKGVTIFDKKKIDIKDVFDLPIEFLGLKLKYYDLIKRDINIRSELRFHKINTLGELVNFGYENLSECFYKAMPHADAKEGIQHIQERLARFALKLKGTDFTVFDIRTSTFTTSNELRKYLDFKNFTTIGDVYCYGENKLYNDMYWKSEYKASTSLAEIKSLMWEYGTLPEANIYKNRKENRVIDRRHYTINMVFPDISNALMAYKSGKIPVVGLDEASQENKTPKIIIKRKIGAVETELTAEGAVQNKNNLSNNDLTSNDLASEPAQQVDVKGLKQRLKRVKVKSNASAEMNLSEMADELIFAGRIMSLYEFNKIREKNDLPPIKPEEYAKIYQLAQDRLSIIREERKNIRESLGKEEIIKKRIRGALNARRKRAGLPPVTDEEFDQYLKEREEKKNGGSARVGGNNGEVKNKFFFGTNGFLNTGVNEVKVYHHSPKMQDVNFDNFERYL